MVGARHINCGDVAGAGAMSPLTRSPSASPGSVTGRPSTGCSPIEFLPWLDIPDAATAWAIAKQAGRANGGVLVDTWHYFRGAADPAQLEAIPPSTSS